MTPRIPNGSQPSGPNPDAGRQPDERREEQLDQRSETRHATANRAQVDILGDEPQSIEAQLVDVSSRGMRLATSQPIAPDTALRIRLGLDQYLGEVTHCRCQGDRYFVGISLFNVMRNVAAVTERLSRILQTR